MIIKTAVDRAYPLPFRERARVRASRKVFSPSPHSSPVKGEEVIGQIGSGLVVSLFLFFVSALTFPLVSAYSQTLAQLVDGAKKEGSLVLSWGTGTLGGIEGVRAIEKTFNKTYGLNFQFKYTPGPAMPQFASRIIQEAFPNVRLIQNETNLGFSLAANIGADAARGKYLVFLNNDTRVDKGWLNALLETLNRDDEIAVYFSETRAYVAIPNFLLTPQFLRVVSRRETLFTLRCGRCCGLHRRGTWRIAGSMSVRIPTWSRSPRIAGAPIARR